MANTALCAWCDETATRNLSTRTEQACEAHYERYAASDAVWAALDSPGARVTHLSRFWTIPAHRDPIGRRMAALQVSA